MPDTFQLNASLIYAGYFSVSATVCSELVFLLMWHTTFTSSHILSLRSAPVQVYCLRFLVSTEELQSTVKLWNLELSLSDAPYSEKTWIGLHDSKGPTGTSEYAWMDGTQLDYVMWKRYVGVSAFGCIAINTDTFYWIEQNCNELSAFICKSPAKWGRQI